MKNLFLAIISLSLVAAALITLIACGSKNGSSSTTTTLEDEKSPWDPSMPPSADSLITFVEPGTKLFSGKEWTGEARSKDVNGDRVNQSEVYAVNEIDYHSDTTIVYSSVEEAYEGAKSFSPEKSSYYKLITGDANKWQLAVYQSEGKAKIAGVLDKFYKTDYDMASAPKYTGNGVVAPYSKAYYGGFKEVTLPASWQTQGFDFPIYSNFTYPWGGAYGNSATSIPRAPTTTNPVGFYRYYLDVEENWLSSGRRVYLTFEGVESAYYLYVNGCEVGYSEDSFDISTFDVTKFLNTDGKDNLIALKVYRWCDGSYFENQDFLRLGGIFRDAYVYSVSGVNISDYQVSTDLDATYTDAQLSISAELYNTTVADYEEGFFSLDVRLVDADGVSVFASEPLRANSKAIASGKKTTVKMEKKVVAPHLWSDEDPYLYTLIISLYDKNGAYYGSIAQQLGFREITFTPTKGKAANASVYSQMLLNGKPLILKGVNRHDNDPEKGRYVSRELITKDVTIMKSLNVNAVRTSHYPNSRYFYDMCDKYGILVLAECNIEDHYGVGTENTDAYFRRLLTDRVESFTETAKNRTCIFMWSIGNEVSTGSSLYPTLIARLKRMDPTRPVHFESLGNSGGVDVASSMYSSIHDVAGRDTASNNMPYLLCEYAHAMGNSVGNLYEYWQVIRASDNILGGFIWDFVDQSLWTDFTPSASRLDYYENGKYLAYGGAWGDNPNSGNFCMNGIISSDRALQSETAEVKYVYQSVWFDTSVLSANAKTVSIFNEYNFTDLSDLAFEYQLLCNGAVVDSGAFSVSCAPGERVSVQIPYTLPENASPDAEYLLTLSCKLKKDTLWAKAGHVLATEQFSVLAETTHVSADIQAMPSLETSSTDDSLTVKGKDFELVFDKAKGEIKSYTYKGEALITSGGVPTYTRARNDNDKNTFSWDSVKVSSAQKLECTIDSSSKFVTVNARLALSAADCYQNMTYVIYGSGEISVSSTLEMGSGMGEMYRYGATLTLPGDFENIVFYGNGPEDTYCDRLRGSHAGIYTTTVTDSFFPYPYPQDTGVKTGVRYFALTSDSKNSGVMIVSKTLTEVSALHYTTSQLQNAKYTYNLSSSKANTYLTVSYGSRGTGGASCGPDALTSYRLLNDGRDYTYAYTIVPFDKEGTDIADTAVLWRDAQSYTEQQIDKYCADAVIALINSLSVDPSGAKQARSAYDSLTPAQKALVTNLSVLESVEAGKKVSITFTDMSPNGNTGKLTSGSIVDDPSSPALSALSGHFTFTDKSGSINTALSGSSLFTVGAYVKLNDLDSHNVIVAKNDNHFAIKTDGSGRIEFFIYSGTWYAALIENPTAVGIVPGQWFYITGVREASELKLYVNGNLIATKSIPQTVASSSTPFGIGTDVSSGRTLRGSVAYVHVLPYAASADQVKAQYESYSGSTEAPFKSEESVLWFDVTEYEYMEE